MFLETLFISIVSQIQTSGLTIFFLLTIIEKLFFLLPLEVVLPYGAYMAQSRGNSIFFVIVVALVGNFLGVSFQYGFGYLLRNIPTIRYLFFSTEEKRLQFEKFLAKKGWYFVLMAPLLPIFGGWIHFFVGCFRYSYLRFLAWNLPMTTLWSFYLSWYGRQFLIENPEALQRPTGLILALRNQFQWPVFLVILSMIMFAYLQIKKNKRCLA